MPITSTCFPAKSESVNCFPSRTSVKEYERKAARAAVGAAVPVALGAVLPAAGGDFAGEGATLPSPRGDRKSTRLNSSHSQISYAVFCLKKKKKKKKKEKY